MPQRDGFEFETFTAKIIEKRFNNLIDISRANAWIIYLLDVGRFLWNADVVIANLDEPLDPGVIVEIMFAH